MKIGLIFKDNLRDKKSIKDILENIAKKNRIELIECEKNTSSSITKNSLKTSNNDRLDFILSLGGDGTMLRSVEYASYYKTPILGVNMGKLGFLTDSNLNEIETNIEALIDKNYRIEPRMLLEVIVQRYSDNVYEQQSYSSTETKYKNKRTITVLNTIALNEAVVIKGASAKLIDLKLCTNKYFVYESRCDGMVISTPTGSTAYSLSAGGPILSPSMNAMIVTPLNPHILTIRPMVFADNDIIEVKICSHNQVYLQIDGNTKCELLYGDKITLKKAKEKIGFVKLSKKNFYRILRKKLNMGKN